MTVEIHLYGKLRRYKKESTGIRDNAITLTSGPDETIASLLSHAAVPSEEVYSIFVNHKLLFTRSNQARWSGHQRARQDPFDRDLEVPVGSGDRIGVFGRDMALLVV